MTYSKEELFCGNEQREYPSSAEAFKFLLGGIGTGNVSVGSRGQLCDWEIFNSQGKGNILPYSFFSIWTKEEDGKAYARVLEARLNKPYERSHGYPSAELGGLPRLSSARLRAEYPFVWVDFADDTLPITVSMEAFTPFIPLNVKDSSLPAAVIRYRVKNEGETVKEVSIAGSLANAVGFGGYNIFGDFWVKKPGLNTLKQTSGLQGLYYTCPDLAEDDLSYGSMALATPDTEISAKPTWMLGGWFDCIHNFWDDFTADGRLDENVDNRAVSSRLGSTPNLRIGSLAIHKAIAPGKEETFTFILAWHFPNRPKAWLGHVCPADNNKPGLVKNHYTLYWGNAWEAAHYLYREMNRLEQASCDFRRALFSSTLPGYVIEALAANITVIRSTTCFRLSTGEFLAWEGGFGKRGCCEGNCTHVWNYTQTLAFLFPELERSMRRIQFLMETDDTGNMAFRSMQVFGDTKWDMLPAADGQLGTIIRLYRDWKFSGDDAFLREVWDKAQKALEFAFGYWDSDGDCVLDSRQHNTYDIEFYGQNSLTNSMFFAALEAGARMAEYLGDHEAALRYRQALESGASKLDRLLWNGEYYIQSIEDINSYKYQYGNGCLSDQLLGQQLAHVAGLGYILPEEHVKSAVLSIFRYNFRDSMKSHENVQRTYALNDEKGLLLCSWPHGGRPELPFVYSDEVWTGVEYQVASHLIFEGYVEEGLTIVKALRERFTGDNRNPFNEIECGNHYARSLASWALLIALSGYKFDMVEKRISFTPKLDLQSFQCFFSTGTVWGIYHRHTDADTGEIKQELEVLYGTLDGIILED
jgi:non-lysosomal glucosylceramidase